MVEMDDGVPLSPIAPRGEGAPLISPSTGASSGVDGHPGDVFIGSGASSGRKPTLTLARKMGFGFGDTATGAVNAIIGFYLLVFLVDVGGIEPGRAAIILLLSKIADGLADPLIGKASDRTRTRWGRRRPWLLFGSLPVAFAYFGLWMVPDLSENGRTAYYLVMLCLFNVSYTFVTVPYVSLTPELAETYHERTVLTGVKTVFLLLSMVITSTMHAVLIKSFADMKTGYMVSAAVVSILLATAPLVVFSCTYERKRAVISRPQLSAMESIKVAVTNKAFVCVCILYVCDWCAVQLIQNNLLLYVTYVLNKPEKFTEVVIIVQVSTILFIPVWTKVARVWGKRVAYYAGGFVLMSVAIGLWAQPNEFKAGLVYTLCFFAGAGVAAAFLIPWSMVPDVIDVDEVRSGERREGIFMGMFVFLMKMGIAVALAIAGFALQSSGFESGVDEKFDKPLPQKPEVIATLKRLVGLGPSILILVSFIPAYFYPINRKSLAETQLALAEIKKAAKNTPKRYASSGDVVVHAAI